MDFALTEEQLAFKKNVRVFAEKEIAPRVLEYNREEKFPWDIMKKMGELGYIGGIIPSEYGGSDLDYLTYVMIVEEFSRVCPIMGTVAASPSSLCGQGLLGWGTEEQKKKYLTPIATGQAFAAGAITEPGCGSDAAAMKTTAKKFGGGYVINGSKTWISNASVAEWILVFTTVDPSLRHKGITAFIVEKGTPGMTTRPIHGKLANRPADTSEIFFEDCFVPEKNRLGEEGDGWKILNASVEIGRLHVAARSTGIVWGCLDASTRYAQERTAFGKTIGQFQLVQAMITDMIVNLENARNLTYKAAWMKDNNDPEVRKYVSMAKLFASRAAVRAASDAIQIHGAYGISDEYHMEKFYREAKIQEIVEGTSQIHTMMVAQYQLGLRKF